MIIWINGAFGAGKTQAAWNLHRRLPGSFVYDPERAGYFIRKNLPKEGAEADFQDYPMWRQFNVQMLRHIAKTHKGHCIVPMTIVNKAYYDEIVGTLAESHTVHHYILAATKETLQKRLRYRFEGQNSWAAAQIDRCIAAFQTQVCQESIDTDGRSIDWVSEEIARRSGLNLLPDNRSRLKKYIDRLATQWQHIR